jgi:hypothetical protein
MKYKVKERSQGKENPSVNHVPTDQDHQVEVRITI